MNLDIKKDRYLTFFFLFLAVLIFSLLICLLALERISTRQIQSANERYESYKLAEGLRQTSEDLTKMVRLYVITGNKKYKDYFNEILSIRNGESPRPKNYYQIYWDLVTDDTRPSPYGEKKSYKEMLMEHQFSVYEYELLRDAQNESDNLAKLEIKAMNAVEGKFDATAKTDVKGQPDLQLARKLVFGGAYLKQKAKIMAPLQQFFEAVEKRTTEENQKLNHDIRFVIIIAIILAISSAIIMIISIVKAMQSLYKATRANEMLLLNILPTKIAERIKKGEKTIAEEFQATILFADIVHFTEMTSRLGPEKTVDILNRLFDEFDDLTAIFGVEKIKTIGDNYMAVAGVPEPAMDHPFRLADFALAIQKKLQEFNQANNLELQMRMGMTYGSVIAGVIGHKKFIYDLWGDVVNIASRMESTGVPGEIQITDKLAMVLEEKFICVERGEPIEVKGKGLMKTYFLKGRKTPLPEENPPVPPKI